MLSIESVGKRYGAKWVLRNVSIDVVTGSAWHIVGQNGAGKSTLLRILAGLTNVDQGTIKRRAGATVRYVGHEPSLYDHMTVSQAIESIVAIDDQINNDNLDQLIEEFELTPHLGTIVANVSQGTRQKASLALAFACPTSLWVLDEPFAHVDQTTCAVVDEWCAEHVSSGAAVVMAHHGVARPWTTSKAEL